MYKILILIIGLIYNSYGYDYGGVKKQANVKCFSTKIKYINVYMDERTKNIVGVSKKLFEKTFILKSMFLAHKQDKAIIFKTVMDYNLETKTSWLFGVEVRSVVFLIVRNDKNDFITVEDLNIVKNEWNLKG